MDAATSRLTIDRATGFAVTTHVRGEARRTDAVTRRIVGVLFIAAAATLASFFAWTIFVSITINRLWEDEAYNLSVPLNLVRGFGYSSDGILSGSLALTRFDPRISTGPTVLLPVSGLIAVGVDPVLAARLVPSAYFLALLGGLTVVGYRVGGRWCALTAAAFPALLDLMGPPSPVQGPADLLGEYAAAALLVWAILALRRHPWLAALLVGLAVQTKFIALGAVPAFVVLVFLWNGAMTVRQRVLRVAIAAAIAAIPTLVYEASAAISMQGAYFEHLRDWFRFLRVGGPVVVTTPAQKFSTFADSWFLPPLIALAMLAGTLGLVVVGILHDRSDLKPGTRALSPRYSAAERTHLAVAALVGFACYALWWLVSTHTPLWIRQPAPGLIVFGGVLATIALATLLNARLADADAAHDDPPHHGRRRHVVATVGLAIFTVVVGAQLLTHAVRVMDRPSTETLADQYAIAEQLQAQVDVAHVVTTWGAPVSMGVLIGAHVSLRVDGSTDSNELPELRSPGQPPCETPTLASSAGYAICAPSGTE